MKKKQVQRLRYAAAFLISAAVGVGGCSVWRDAAQPAAPAFAQNAAQVQAEGMQVRVRGGVAEWFDGVRWNAAGAVEQLEQEDPTAARSETWQLLQQRAAAKQQQRQSALTQLSREANALSTGQKPAAQTTPSRRPATTTATPPAAAPAPTPTPPTPPPTPTPAPSGDGTDLDGGALWG